MRSPAPPPESCSGLPAGAELLPLGLLMVAGVLHFTVTMYYFLTGITPSSEVHLRLSVLLAPLACLVAILWIAMRVLRLVTPETGTGFSLAAYGLAARTLAELGVWFAPPPGRAFLDVELAPSLLDAVRYLGVVAVLTGLAFVVASSAHAAGHRLGRRSPHRPRWAARIVALACVVAVTLLVWRWTPAVTRFLAS